MRQKLFSELRQTSGKLGPEIFAEGFRSHMTNTSGDRLSQMRFTTAGTSGEGWHHGGASWAILKMAYTQMTFCGSQLFHCEPKIFLHFSVFPIHRFMYGHHHITTLTPTQALNFLFYFFQMSKLSSICIQTLSLPSLHCSHTHAHRDTHIDNRSVRHSQTTTTHLVLANSNDLIMCLFAYTAGK